MANKAIFVGLGGAGVRTAGHIKAKLLFQAYDGDSKLLAQDCRFIFIDTADDAVNEINKVYSERLRDNDLIDEDRERVNLGDVNPWAIYATAKEDPNQDRVQHLLSWVDEEGSREFPAQPLSDGAGGNRQVGRLAVWHHLTDIRAQISSALSILATISRDELQRTPPRFYLLSGTCGGTGSSCFLDVAYILDREYKLIKGEGVGDPIVRAVLFMPQWYIQLYRDRSADIARIEDYQSNAFAFMEEIKFFLYDRYANRDGTKFIDIAVAQNALYKSLPVGDRAWPVFNFAICIDSTISYAEG